MPTNRANTFPSGTTRPFAPGSDPQTVLVKQTMYHYAPGSDPQYVCLQSKQLTIVILAEKQKLSAKANLGLVPPQWFTAKAVYLYAHYVTNHHSGILPKQ